MSIIGPMPLRYDRLTLISHQPRTQTLQSSGSASSCHFSISLFIYRMIWSQVCVYMHAPFSLQVICSFSVDNALYMYSQCRLVSQCKLHSGFSGFALDFLVPFEIKHREDCASESLHHVIQHVLSTIAKATKTMKTFYRHKY